MKWYMKVVVFGLLVTLGACGNVVEVDALVGVTNNSDDWSGLLMNSREVGNPIPPRSSVQMMLKVQVPAGRSGDPTAPADERVYAVFSVQNFTTSEFTDPIQCRAGAKVITSLFYEMRGREPNTYGRLECDSYTSYSMIDTVQVSLGG